MTLLKIGYLTLLFLLLSVGTATAQKTVQSLVVNFPANGRVIVQAQTQLGEFPQMIFISEKTGRVLFRSLIEDQSRELIAENEEHSTSPDLRFRVIRSSAFLTPMIMSVGLAPGGSDDKFFLTVFGEINGKIRRLTDEPIFATIQGGFYLGFLNRKLGAGLTAWNFIWGNNPGESHYSKHKYEIAIYRLQGTKFKRTLKKASQRMYAKGSDALQEVGIRGFDQRKRVPKINEFLE